ncbi:AAA family ATPase [Photobacterium minamisatsumaniensis]|uniref:AAA family ATPase n=1 Tax=Photobacterium minamisatsumaniensis TaxID=2910233 RepID=UPI003D09C343
MKNVIVFTGGPGSGKTSVIERLNALGYKCASEVGRKVIQNQVESQGSALPWGNKVAFRDEMVREELENYKKFDVCQDTVFFDRSIIDSYGYSLLEQLPMSEALLKSCDELEYCKKVFIFPPWETIFTNDLERKQDFNEAVATYNEMEKAYKKFGYELVEVPKSSISKRVNFILASVKSW